LVTVIETEAFARRADKLLNPEERDGLVAFLAANPTAGDLIEGTGGVRKVRFAAQGKGKSGGVWVVYYFVPEGGPLYALLLYAKSEQADLSPGQRQVVAGEGCEGCSEGEVEAMSEFGEELIEAVEQALAHARGERLPGTVVHRVVVLDADEVRAIRTRTGLSRPKFAERFGLDVRALQDWEQGRRAPDRAARVLLLTIDRHPEAVADALLA
jgi:DNA-binding transcriptional regulator YiaG